MNFTVETKNKLLRLTKLQRRAVIERACLLKIYPNIIQWRTSVDLKDKEAYLRYTTEELTLLNKILNNKELSNCLIILVAHQVMLNKKIFNYILDNI